jgi:tRNA threonylcarbamoyladenosine modification (KEOPS) complex  Pcc1 subunit
VSLLIARIQLDFKSEAEAKRTFSAIAPDNHPLPSGLEIECSINHHSLTIIIRSERSLESLGATLEDIMSAIDLSMRTSKSVDTK